MAVYNTSPQMRIAILMAARNEETTLPKSLGSLTKIISPKHIYVVNDGSTDNTEKVAQKFKINVYTNPINIGKTRSLHHGITKGKLLKRYQAVMFLDADTEIDPDFIRHALPHLQNPKVAVTLGQVETRYVPDNIFIAYRAYAYIIWQQFWKRVFNPINAITIAPGTASIYKSHVLEQLDFDSNLIIEDFDLTFQVHRKKLGRIVYESKSKVYTQDPNNLTDYYKQMIRWNLGQLQTMLKHRVPLKLQSFELILIGMFIPTITHAIILAFFPVFIFTLIIKYLTHITFLPPIVDKYISYFIFTDFFLLISTVIIYLGIYRRKFKIQLLSLFWLIQFVNVAALLVAIYRLTQKRTSIWTSPTRWTANTKPAQAETQTPTTTPAALKTSLQLPQIRHLFTFNSTPYSYTRSTFPFQSAIHNQPQLIRHVY